MKGKKIASPVATSVGEKKKNNLQNNYTSKKSEKQESKKERPDSRTRNWAGLLWLKSAKEDWLTTLMGMKDCKIAISPVHDHDANSDGEKVDPHVHIAFMYNEKKSYLQQKEIMDLIGGQYPLQIGKGKKGEVDVLHKDMYAFVRYFCHLDDIPQKYLYQPSEIKSINGFDVEKYLKLRPEEKYREFNEILEICESEKISNLFLLRRYVSVNCPYYLKYVLSSAYQSAFSNYFKGMLWEKEKQARVNQT